MKTLWSLIPLATGKIKQFMRPSGRSSAKRWCVAGIFTLCTAVNFLDRQVFSALAPTMIHDLHISGTQYGELLSAFGLAYALGTPVAGRMVDRIGLDKTITIAVALWSFAAMLTGASRSLATLMICRLVLGLGESAGMPTLAKFNAAFLQPREYAFSLAINNIAIAAGSAGAPLLVSVITPSLGWHAAFWVTGAFGSLWIPLWLATAGRRKERVVAFGDPSEVGPIMKDRRLWILMVTNLLIMTAYTVWTGWTTLYFVKHLHVDATTANRNYVWVPPVCATIGGFVGGWIIFKWMTEGLGPIAARLRACWVAAAFIVPSVALPLVKSPPCAAALIGFAMFWAMGLQMNVHILPVDIFGLDSAGFTVSVLACSYGLLQFLVS